MKIETRVTGTKGVLSLPAGDFPNVDHFKEVLSVYNIDKFEKLRPKIIQVVDDMLSHDIPNLLKTFSNP